MAWCRRSRRGRRTRQRHRRVPQELGTPGGSLSTTAGTGWPDPNTPGPSAGVGPGGETNTGAREGTAPRSSCEARRDGLAGIGAPHSTDEAGELAPRGPGGGKGAPRRGTAGRKHGRYAETGTRVNKATAASGAGAAVAAVGVHLPQPLPGPPLADRGLQSHPRGRCPGRGRTDRRGLWGQLAGEPAVAPGARQVRHVPSAPRPACAHSQGTGLGRDAPPGDPDLRGQGPPAGGRHGPGADLRARLPGLLLRLPARAVGAHGGAGVVAAGDGPGWLLDLGGGYPEVFRHPGSSPAATVASAAGARWRVAPPDRQVVEGVRSRGRRADAPRGRNASRGCDLADAGERVTGLRAGRVVVGEGQALDTCRWR